MFAIGTGGVGLEAGLLKAGLTSGLLSSGNNLMGQYAGTRDLGEVDYAGVVLSFVGGFIPNPLASTVITGAADAGVDYKPNGGFSFAGGNKSNTAVFGDLLFNIGLGSINNGIKKEFPRSNFMTQTNDFMIQYGNTVASETIPE